MLGLYNQAIEYLDTIESQRKECVSNGRHLDVYWFYMPTETNPRDLVRGICFHCLTEIVRSLNKDEQQRINNQRILNAILAKCA